MLSRSRLLVAALLCALTYTGLTMAPAQAASVPKVTSVAYAGQNSATGQIKVKWKKVKGAKYQLRWAPSSSKLKSAKLYSSTATSAYSPVLSNRCVSWYVQVRAIKKGKKGKFSTPKAVKLKVGYPTKPVGSQINTTTQTDPTSAQIRWSTTANVAKARLHWSAAPFEKWIGFDNRTAFTTGHSLSIKLPASPVPGDRTISPAYGNPIFGELEVSNGCTSSLPSTAYVAMFPKPADPGNASTGDALAVASYNVENTPTAMNNPTKIANIAANINSRSLDIVLLQEATPTTATDLKATLGSDWEVATPLAGLPAQQVLFRTSKYTWNSTTNVGQAIDGTATTPIPTPAVRLDPIPPVDPPATGDPISQSILVVSVHFEDRWKYFPDATSEERRADAKANAQALISNITNANPDNLPVIVGGDFIGKPVDKQGNVSYCDESTPGCVGEGQPTFIRAGYWDSQNAQTKIGLQYGTVIGHTQLRTTTFGFAGRADFIVMKGIKGSKTYENMPKFSTSNTEQSDHAMIRTDIFVPKVPAP